MVTGGKDFRRTYSAQLTFLPKCATIRDMVAAFVNPVNFAKLVAQEPLNPAEQMFVDCVTGKVKGAEDNSCVIGKTRPEMPIYKGENANVIRADLIRFFAWGGNGEIPVMGNTIALCGAYVRGALNLVHAHSPYALALMNCHFAEHVWMAYARFHSLDLGGSYFAVGLVGRGMRVGGDLHINDVFVPECGVNLTSANIGGDLNCRGGQFKNASGFALLADNASIGGNLFMCTSNDGARFCANGGAHLGFANITGNLDCGGGEFINPEKYAFAVNGAKMGNLRMTSNNGSPFVANGDVGLIAAEIDISCNCEGGHFDGDIIAESAKIGKSLFWRKVRGRGTVGLQGAAAGIFDYDDEQSLGGFNFILDGFSYRQFAEHKEVQSRLKWLDSRPAKMPFSPHPFEQAAKVLFAMGYNNDAREVLLKKERLLTKHGKLPFWRKYLWRPIWNLLAGYGHQLWRTFFGAAVFIAAGAYLYDFADRECRITPHQPIAVLNEKYEFIRPGKECTDAHRPTSVMAKKYPDYPRFDAWAFSLDVFIPVFALHQESHWYPQQQEGDTNVFLRWLRLLYWIQIGAGWILTSLLVLTITGLLRPRQSGGE